MTKPDAPARNLRTIALAAAGVALLAGCAVGPDFVRPAAPGVDRYTREPQAAVTDIADGQSQRFMPDAGVPADWWRLFRSPSLDAAMQQALRHNPTLQSAEASLRQSQDNLRAGNGVFYPRVDAALAATRARTAPAVQGSSAASTLYKVVTLSGSISYPLDVFGGERRTVEGLAAQVDNQHFTTKAAYLALEANLVNACIARAAYSAQLRATEELIALEVDQLHSIEAQVRAGTAPYANQLSQRSLIASNKAQLATLAQKISQTDHLLALLQGDAPAEASLPEIDLAELVLPQDLPLSLPSQLLRQRPDILAAEAQLRAASANIGVATAAMFPSFTLSADYGTAGSGLGNLLAAGGRYWSFAPAIAMPLLRGGTLRAQRQAAIDAYDARQADYRQTVLAAFAQVADVLQALAHDAQVLQAQADAQRAAADALALQRASYRAGMVAYLDVQAADVQFHSATISYLAAVAQRHQDTVALFAALGGGWWNAKAAETDTGKVATP
ncbi:efflux transporter outer membrane subunit [Variovorax sp. VaC1]|uniref:efflux transporter outer membrane subunit n=1 Tax=Variovorax sp. VaC1 TaxID=3373132 RepID=UPI003748E41B